MAPPPALRRECEYLGYLRHCVYDAIAECKARQLLLPLSQNDQEHRGSALLVPFEMDSTAQPRDCAANDLQPSQRCSSWL